MPVVQNTNMAPGKVVICWELPSYKPQSEDLNEYLWASVPVLFLDMAINSALEQLNAKRLPRTHLFLWMFLCYMLIVFSWF